MFEDWSPVEKTLAIPLAGRACARERFPELGFRDAAAEKAFAALPEELKAPMLRDRSSLWGSIVRTQIFDQAVRDFLRRNPAALVLSLGSGFCTRADRLAPEFPQARWVEMDFGAVTRAKAQLLGSRPVRAVEGSITEHARLEPLLGAEPALIVSEGVLMFLEAEDHQALLAFLGRRLPAGSELVFDYIHPWIKAISPYHPSLKPTGASYRSGYRRIGPELSALSPRLQLLDSTLFSKATTGALRLLSRLIRLLTGGASLYDVARVRVS